MSDKVSISGTISLEDKASPTIRAIQKNIAGITDQARKVGQGFARFANMGVLGGVAKNARNAASAIAGIGKSIVSVGSKLAGIVGLAGFGGLAFELQKYVDNTEGLAKMAQQLGITAQELQMLRGVARGADVDVGTFDDALLSLSRRLADADLAMRRGKTSTNDLASLMEKARIPMGSVTEVLPMLANAFSRTTDQGTRTRIMIAAFGKTGQELIPVLAGGGAEMKKMMEAMKEAGLITQQQIDDAKAFSDAQKAMNRSIKGVSTAIMATLVPALTPLIDKFTAWVKLNKTWIAGGITDAIKDFSAAVKAVNWQPLLKGLGKFVDMMKAGFKWIGGWKVLLPVLAVIMGLTLVSAIWSVVTAVVALNAALLTNPFVLAATAIGFLAFSMYQARNDIKKAFDDIVKSGKEAGDRLGAGFKDAGKQAQQFGKDLAEPGGVERKWRDVTGFFDQLGTDLGKSFTRLRENMQQADFSSGFIEDAWKPLTGFFDNLFPSIGTSFKRFRDDMKSWDFSSGFIEDAWRPLTGWFGEQWSDIKGKFWDAVAWVGEFGGVFNGERVTGAWQSITGWFGTLWTDVKGMFWRAVSWVGEFAGQFIPQPVKDAWQSLTGWFTKLWADIKGKFWTAVAWVGEFVGSFVPQPVKDAWGSLIGWFGTLWQGIKDKFWGAVAWIGEFAGSFLPVGIQGAWQSLTGWFATLWAGIKTKFWSAVAWIGDFVGQFIPQPVRDAWNSLLTWFGTLWADIKTKFWSAVSWVGEFAGQFIPASIEGAWQSLLTWFGTLWTNIKTKFWENVAWIGEFAAKFVPAGIETAWNGVTKYFTDLWAGVTKAFDDAWKKIQEITGWIMGKVQPVIDGVNKITASVKGLFGFGPEVQAAAEAPKPVADMAEKMKPVAEMAEKLTPPAATVPPGGMYGSYSPVAAAPAGPASSPWGSYSPVQAAQQPPPPQRIEGGLKADLNIGLAPGLVLNSQTTQERGAVRDSTVKTGNTGLSMAPAT